MEDNLNIFYKKENTVRFNRLLTLRTVLAIITQNGQLLEYLPLLNPQIDYWNHCNSI